MIRVSSYTLVACRSGRDEQCDYWFGLYKITSQHGSGSYWYATTWYGGFLSSFRWWADSYPRLRYALCFVYTADGWKDANCTEEHCFTCKKCPGTNRYDTTRGAVLARAQKPTRVSVIYRTASVQSSVAAVQCCPLLNALNAWASTPLEHLEGRRSSAEDARIEAP